MCRRTELAHRKCNHEAVMELSSGERASQARVNSSFSLHNSRIE